MDREEASRRTRARLAREREEKTARLREERKASLPIQSRAGVPVPSPSPTKSEPPITDKSLQVCHVTVVLRRKVGEGHDYHRLNIQVGCGTHLGDSKMDYASLTHPGAHDLPQKGEVFGRDMARVVAAELNRRKGLA